MADIFHSVIPDAYLHEPKGVASAAANTVYLADGAGSGAWTSLASSIFPVVTTYWNQVFIPANRIRLPGAATDPGVDTDGNTLLFDASTNEIVFEHVELPRDRLDGTDVRFYVYWAKTTSASGDVAWDLDYKINAIAGVISGTWQSLASAVATPLSTDADTAEQVLLTYLDFLDTSTLSNGDLIQLRLTRNATDSGDTYASDCRMLGILMTYNIANPGTTVEFT